MSKTYKCTKCEGACHVFTYEEKLVLKCYVCGPREITQKDLNELEKNWKNGNK